LFFNKLLIYVMFIYTSLVLICPMHSYAGISPVDIVSVSVDKNSPQVQGAIISLTANATGGSGNYEYYFTLRDPYTSTWFAEQPYSGNPSWVWDTAAIAPGIYMIQVWARNVGSTSPYEAYCNLFFTINSSITGINILMDKVSPQMQGAVVTFTASNTGGSGNYEYCFMVWNPYTRNRNVVQTYSSSPVWTWDTTTFAPGVYTVEVWTRKIGSIVPNEASKNIAFAINSRADSPNGSGNAVADIVGSPTGLTNQTNPIISVSGKDVVAYRYKLDGQGYSEELSANVNLKFAADVSILGRKFTAGDKSLQEYLNYRNDYIEGLAFDNVSIDTPVVFLLNNKRAYLSNNNILNLEGSNIGQLTVQMNDIPATSGDSNADLASFTVSNGKLKQIDSADIKSFMLELPISISFVSITPTAIDSRSSIKIDGLTVLSGTQSTQIPVSDGTSISITTTSVDGSITKQYVISVALSQSFFADREYLSYYLSTYTPNTDYIRISNHGNTTASFIPNLNNKLFASSDDVLSEIRALPPDYENEPIERKVWRFVVNNRYVHWSITPSFWGTTTPAFFFNSLGFGMCGNAAALYCQLMYSLGYQTRVWDLNGHVVPEVFINGKWEMYDSDFAVYYSNLQGEVAGVEELIANPNLIVNPINPLVGTFDGAYSQSTANWYSSTVGTPVNTWYDNDYKKNYLLTLQIPSNGSLEFPHAFAAPIRTWYYTEAPSYTNARLTIPRGWAGYLNTPLAIHSIGYDGPHTLSVIAKDSAGNWQSNPTIVNWTTDSFEPMTTIVQPPFSNSITFTVNKPATIYYTLDGSVPTTNSQVYQAPIDFSMNPIVKYFAVDLAGNREKINNFNDSPATSVSMAVDKNSPQLQGASMLFEASASGCSSGRYEYSYWILNLTPNHSRYWVVVQAYSENSKWTWNTAGADAGPYKIQVWAKCEGSIANYETFAQTLYVLNPPPATGITLAMDKRSPREPGEVITFTASATGGSGNYEYYYTLKNPNTGQWSVGQAYSGNPKWTWNTTGLSAGKYMLQVWARSAGSSEPYEAFQSVMYTLNAPATGVTLAMDKRSPREPGEVITFTASATGGSGNYEYYYTLKNPNTGQWSVGQAYSGKPTWTWDTTGLSAGTYMLEVWARSAGSSSAYEAFQSVRYTLNTPATGVILMMDKCSPREPGAMITFTASATGGSGSYEYYFTLKNPNTGQWSVGQAYSGNPTWTWNTTGLSAGTYMLEVWARSTGSSSPYEAFQSVTYTLNTPATSVTLAMDKNSPREPGAAIAFTASAAGGSGNYEYYYTLKNPNTGKWSVGQAYSGNPTWTWDTTGLSAGTYMLEVWARSAGSSSAYEAFQSIRYTLNTPATGVTLMMDKSSPREPGAMITFTASATGGSGSYEYYFTLKNPNTGQWSVGQAYSGNPTWTWDTTGLSAGTYMLEVWARSTGSSSAYEAFQTILYTIKTLITY